MTKHLLIVFLSIVLIGCARTQSAQFYLLSSTSNPVGGGASNEVSIGISPISFPDYLKLPQIVTRESNHEIAISEYHRWAEPLSDSFANVLRQDLSGLLKTDHVYLYPWDFEDKVKYKIKIEVIRFDSELGKDSILEVLWALYEDEVGTVDESQIHYTRATYVEQLEGSEYKYAVVAMSKNIKKLAKDIVRKL